MPPKQLNRTAIELCGGSSPPGLLSPHLRGAKHLNEGFFDILPIGLLAKNARESRAGSTSGRGPPPGQGANQTALRRTIPSGTCTNPRTRRLINLYSLG